jgi:hypothetical protein
VQLKAKLGERQIKIIKKVKEKYPSAIGNATFYNTY